LLSKAHLQNLVNQDQNPCKKENKDTKAFGATKTIGANQVQSAFSKITKSIMRYGR
jgi:hypothetical protein